MAVQLDSQVKAMISLLDDEDETIFNVVSQKLLPLAGSDKPEAAEILKLILEKKNESIERVQVRLDSFIDKLQFEKLKSKFIAALMENASIEEFSFLIAQIGFPELDVKKYREELNRIESVLRLDFAGNRDMTDIDKIIMISVVLFEREGFRGNSGAYYEPDNSYINRVMDRKLGIPISLGAVFLALTDRLGIPVFGVNMPSHFMLKYEQQKFGPDIYEVFIDPFNQGRILEKQDCIRFLTNSGYGFVEQYLAKAQTIDIVERMLNNLRNSYTELSLSSKVILIERYLDLIREFRGDEIPNDEGTLGLSEHDSDLDEPEE